MCGLGMIEELARHGYRISAGSMYPLLQGLERKDTCDPPSTERASRCGECTGQRRWDERHWLRRKARCGSFFMNSSKVIRWGGDFGWWLL